MTLNEIIIDWIAIDDGVKYLRVRLLEDDLYDGPQPTLFEYQVDGQEPVPITAGLLGDMKNWNPGLRAKLMKAMDHLSICNFGCLTTAYD